MHRIKPKREIIFSKCRYAYGVPYVINDEMLDKIISNYGEGSIERLDKVDVREVDKDCKNIVNIKPEVAEPVKVTPVKKQYAGLITSTIIHYKRSENMPEVLGGIKRQTIKSDIWVWDNSGECPSDNIDVLIKSSHNFVCHPRLILGGMVRTKYIWTQDDDVKITDDTLFEDLLKESEKYPEYWLCYNGRTMADMREAKPEKVYSNAPITWDGKVVVGNMGVSFYPVKLLNRLPVNPYINDVRRVSVEEFNSSDDIWVTSFVKSRAWPGFKNRIKRLDEQGVGLSWRGNPKLQEHWESRNGVTKRYVFDEKCITENIKKPWYELPKIKLPLVSVILATYNRPDYIINATESYKMQDYENKELIIINDGSQVGQYGDFIKQYVGGDISFETVEHRGLPTALNTAIKKAKGEYIVLLGDDDEFFDSQSLYNRVAPLISSEAEVTWTSAVDIYSGQEPVHHSAPSPDKERIWKEDYIHAPSMAWKKSVHDVIGYFSPDLISNEDWEFKIKCLMECRCKAVNNITLKYRRHGLNKSVVNRGNGIMEKCRKTLFDRMYKRYDRTERMNYKYGIVIPVYNRSSLLKRTLKSFLQIIDMENIKIVFVDDCSTDLKVTKILQDFKKTFEKKPGCKVEIIRHKENYGIHLYYKTLTDGLELLSDCWHKITGCADAEFNSYLMQFWDKANYLLNDYSCISVFNDNRDFFKSGKEINNYFVEGNNEDGFFCLFRDFDILGAVKSAEKHPERVQDGGTGVWRAVNDKLQGSIIRFKESLICHIGNDDSALKPEYRKRYPIHSLNLNLENKPKYLDTST